MACALFSRMVLSTLALVMGEGLPGSVDRTDVFGESLESFGEWIDDSIDVWPAYENSRRLSNGTNDTEAPTEAPSLAPTEAPTIASTAAPTLAPSAAPTEAPTAAPTEAPTAVAPTAAPPASTAAPTESPVGAPTPAPTVAPTEDNTTMDVDPMDGSLRCGAGFGVALLVGATAVLL